jgi:hypothetical protein
VKPSLWVLILVCSGYSLNACGGGSTSPPPPPPPAPATHFSVTAPPSATSGSSFSFTVTALDSTNNVVTSYSGKVAFSSTDKNAQLPASSTLSDGSATFSATLRTSGNESITATDTSMGTLSGVSNMIAVSGPVTHLVLSVPATATTRTQIMVAVTALDASNNLSPSYSGTVHVTTSDAKAILPPDTLVAGGTANLPVVLETTGNQTITVTDTAISSLNVTSSAVSVAGAAPPVISASALPSGTVGEGYNPHWVRVCVQWIFPASCFQWRYQIEDFFQLTATGGVQPNGVNWSWAAAAGSSLPPGLTLSGARISGTPPVGSAGTYQVVVTVTDSGAPPAQTSTTFPLTIANPPPPVINTTPAPSAGAVDLPYSFAFTANSASTPLTWSISAGAPPPGLALSPAGVLSGTPTATGTSSLTLIAEDSLKQDSAPQAFNIQIFAHGFQNVGNMAGPRIAHTATLLNNGKVLVAGGTDANGSPVATAEIYDPTTGTFSTTGNMATARAHFAATLLANGKVLVTGGLDTSGNPLATAEIYDPTAGTFSATTGNMVYVHASHTATLLNTGKVLVVGWGNVIAELFDPSAGTFTATGSMVEGRVSHTATLLSSGKVLLTGGIQGAPPATTVLAEAELYDPATGSFSQTLGSLATARQWHTASLLSNGKVLVAGGMVDNSGTATATAELYDPTTGLFSATGSLASVRDFHTASALKDGTILLTGGDDGGGTLASAEVYDPSAGTFGPTGGMQASRESHTATLLNDGTVLLAGGAGSAPATAEVYK